MLCVLFPTISKTHFGPGLTFTWSDIQEIAPFSPFVPCISVCVLSNLHAYTIFLVIFPLCVMLFDVGPDQVNVTHSAQSFHICDYSFDTLKPIQIKFDKFLMEVNPNQKLCQKASSAQGVNLPGYRCTDFCAAFRQSGLPPAASHAAFTNDIFC